MNEKLRDKLETSEQKSTSFQNNAQTVDKDIKVETQTLSKDGKNSQVIEDTKTKSENLDSKTKDKGDDSSQVKEGKKEDKILADGENVESKKDKQKAKRKEYAKYSITNNADYKIRKKLDEADKLLDEVGMVQRMTESNILSYRDLLEYLSRDMWFPTMWLFDKCRLRRVCAASFYA